MEQEHTSSLSAQGARYWPSKWEWAAYVFSLLIALALPAWDAVHNRSPDTHPLQTDRLWLRIAGIFFVVVNFAIFGAVAYRLGRLATRRRKGLCIACGYDLRASNGRCPECGRPFERCDPGSPSHYPLTRWQVRILKVFSACDSWQFYLACAIGCGIAAFFIKDPWIRVAIACFALPDLYRLIRRIQKRPATAFERMLRGGAR